jgi:hypothetical protein
MITDEMVELAARAMRPGAFEVDDDGNFIQNIDRKDALRDARASLTAAIGDGVVVPGDATEEMQMAGINASPMWPMPEIARRSGSASLNTNQASEIYRAMIAAARS